MIKKNKNKNGKKPIRKPAPQRSVKKGPQMPEEWLYLAEEEITPEQIYGLFGEGSRWKAEYWEAAGVLEIELPEAGSVDLEDLFGEAEDEVMADYLTANQIHSVYAVTIRPDDFEKAKEVMEYITSQLGGYFCGDTEDFAPRVPSLS